MKVINHLLLVVLVSSMAGCSREDEKHAETPELQLYDKGNGLRLPDDMIRTLGVETAEVTERTFQRQLEVTAKVYEGGHGLAPARATALLDRHATSSLKPGQTVALVEVLGESQVITGRLARIDTQIAHFGQVEALIEFPDPERSWKVGASLTAIFPAGGATTGFAVPESAVLQSSETMFVYTVNGAHFVRTPVKTGARSGGWTEILDGLYAGDVVATGGCDAMWMIELCALKGGTPCCPVGKRPGRNGD